MWIGCQILVWLAFSLTIVCAQWTAASSQPPSLIRIAYIGPISVPNPNAVQFGAAGLFTFRAAIKKINDDAAAWRANQTLPKPILANTLLEGLWYDSGSDLGTSVNVACDAVEAGAIAIVGEWQTDPTKQVAYIAGRYHLPQVSVGAAGLEFTTDHDTLYPYFMRMVPQVGLQAFQMTHLIRNYFSWKKIAVLYASDSFGSGGAQIMAQTARDIDLTILAQISFTLNDADFSYQIDRLVASNARIFVYWGLTADFQNFMLSVLDGFNSGKNPNLFGEGYQWIVDHVAVSRMLYLNATGSPIPGIIDLMPGMLGVNMFMNYSTPIFQAYRSYLSKQPSWNVTSSVRPGSIGSSVTWDAVHQIAMGADYMIQQGLDPHEDANRRDFYSAIRNRTWIGTTGKIILDEVGDRVTGYAVMNFQRRAGNFVNVGLLTADGEFEPFPQTPSIGPIEYAGSDATVIPVDTPPRRVVTVPKQVRDAIIIVAGIILAAIVLVQIALWRFRHHNLIKGSSPLFLWLFLVGVQLLCASTIPRALEGDVSLGALTCNADLYLANLGYSLLVLSLAVKTFRLQHIFNLAQLKTDTKLGDELLLSILALAMLIETGVLLALQYGAPMEMQLSSYDAQQDYYSCRSGSIDERTNHVDSIYLPVTISTRFFLLIATAVMAFRVRNVPDVFNESRQLAMTVYNLLASSLLLPAIDGAIGRGKEVSSIAYATCVFLICTTTVSVMLFPKFLLIRRGRSNQKFAVGKGSNGQDQNHTMATTGSTTSDLRFTTPESGAIGGHRPTMNTQFSMLTSPSQSSRSRHVSSRVSLASLIPPSTQKNSPRGNHGSLGNRTSNSTLSWAPRASIPYGTNTTMHHRVSLEDVLPEESQEDYSATPSPQPLTLTDQETLIGAGSSPHSSRNSPSGSDSPFTPKKPLTFHMSESVVVQFMSYMLAKQHAAAKAAASSPPTPVQIMISPPSPAVSPSPPTILEEEDDSGPDTPVSPSVTVTLDPVTPSSMLT